MFRLAQLLPPDQRVELANTIANDLREFLGSIRDDDAFDPKTFDVPLTRAEGIAMLESVYVL